MIKKFVAAAVAMAMSFGLMAQNVQETVVTVGALTVPAYTMTLEKDAKLVEGAVKARLNEAKLKTKNSEGYIAAVEQVVPELAAVPVSLYAKVTEQGKKKNKVTVITLCATSTDLTIDQNMLKDNVRTYLGGFAQYIQRYEASQNMAAQQQELKKAQKAVSAAESAVAGLEKDIASSQKKIADKRNEIEKLKEKIKDCEKEISSLEKSIEKSQAKKADAEKRVDAAKADARAVEARTLALFDARRNVEDSGPCEEGPEVRYERYGVDRSRQYVWYQGFPRYRRQGERQVGRR